MTDEGSVWKQIVSMRSCLQKGVSLTGKNKEWIREIAQKSLAEISKWTWGWVKLSGGEQKVIAPEESKANINA